jgi:hypothetical protein
VVIWTISDIFRWTNPDGNVYVPYANVNGVNRNFNLNDFRNQLNSNYGVLVLSQLLHVPVAPVFAAGAPVLNSCSHLPSMRPQAVFEYHSIRYGFLGLGAFCGSSGAQN